MKVGGVIKEKGFWDYVERWQKVFSSARELGWERTWLKNGYCADCRFCCGPQDSALPFPMPLTRRQLRPDLEKDFFLLDAATPCLCQNGCKAVTEHGCRLDAAQKPMACGFFPIVFINGGLYLYQNCPAVIYTPLIHFLDFARNVAELLLRLDEADLRHICLWFTDDILARSYIDLRLRLLTASGCKLESGAYVME